MCNDCQQHRDDHHISTLQHTRVVNGSSYSNASSLTNPSEIPRDFDPRFSTAPNFHTLMSITDMADINDSTAPKAAEEKADILKTGSATMSDAEPKDVGLQNQQMLLGGEAERKLVRKLDVHIIPIVMLLYLLSFLDRYVSWDKMMEISCVY